MLESKKERSKGIVALVFLAFAFSTMGVFARFFQEAGLGDFQQIYLRYLIGLIVTFFCFGNKLNKNLFRNFTLKTWFSVVIRTFAFAIGVFSYLKAVFLAPLGNVAFIVSVPYIAFWGIVLFREKFTWSIGLYLFLSMIGVALISHKTQASGFTFGRGELLAFVSGLFFNLGIISRRWFPSDYSDGFLTQLFIVTGLPLFVCGSIFKHETILFPIKGLTLFFLVLAGCLIVLNIFLGNYSMVRVEAVLAGNILMLESVFGVLLGLIFYREIPELKSILGGCLILISIFLMNREKETPVKN